MYLQKLEAVGFKSFADKVGLDFLAPTTASAGVTAIVGPNGSGKSNVADAIRWVLGEQSAKLLRGKKAEDVLFSGSEKRGKSNFAEVILHLNNEDGAIPLDFSEVTISRRIYRSGESEYLINKNKVRLTDIQLLLAEANFGARTYAVIGQGMIGDILVASPQERKDFFDEAAGVKQFQIKRHQSINKMNTAKDNLAQAEMLITEIEPRLRSLSRQVKRLNERGTLKEELHALQHQYYGHQWMELKTKLDGHGQRVENLSKQWKEKEKTLEAAKQELSKLEREETGDDKFSRLNSAYEKTLEQRNRLRNRQMQVKSKMEIAREVKKQTRTIMPLTQIISTVGTLGKDQSKALTALKKAKTFDGAKATITDFEDVGNALSELGGNLDRPTTAAPVEKHEADPKLVKELAEITKEIEAAEKVVAAAQVEVRNYSRGESEKKAQFFGLQRSLQEKINSAHSLERQLSDQKIEVARLDTRKESLEQEMTAELGENVDRAKQSYTPNDGVRAAELLPSIEKLKYQLQLIGGIDPEVVKEYEETSERYQYLESQINDLNGAIIDLDRVIAELDMTIKARSEAVFKKLNQDFDRYFKILFDGGTAGLTQIKEMKNDDADKDNESGDEDDSKPKGKRREVITGVDIHATPPGKKIKNVTMLSGGERAMTSIALICAILVNNPSPFVVLDEVDAALDESNAERFGAILEELAQKTQFIVITHNRNTMRKAAVLYGVTMRDNGTSALLSINLEEVDNLEEKSREAQKV